MILADRNVTVLEDHVCAQLSFLANDLFVMQPGYITDSPVEDDPALPFACAIRGGAVEARAEVAILETHNAELQRILDRYWIVQFGSPDELAKEWFGLVYMCDAWVEGWAPAPTLLDRDELPGGPGRTLFASRGWRRFY